MNKRDAICDYLKKNHTGASKAVHSDMLERLFSCTGRSLRRYVSQLRQEGYPYLQRRNRLLLCGQSGGDQRHCRKAERARNEDRECKDRDALCIGHRYGQRKA